MPTNLQRVLRGFAITGAIFRIVPNRDRLAKIAHPLHPIREANSPQSSAGPAAKAARKHDGFRRRLHPTVLIDCAIDRKNEGSVEFRELIMRHILPDVNKFPNPPTDCFTESSTHFP